MLPQGAAIPRASPRALDEYASAVDLTQRLNLRLHERAGISHRECAEPALLARGSACPPVRLRPWPCSRGAVPGSACVHSVRGRGGRARRPARARYFCAAAQFLALCCAWHSMQSSGVHDAVTAAVSHRRISPARAAWKREAPRGQRASELLERRAAQTPTSFVHSVRPFSFDSETMQRSFTNGGSSSITSGCCRPFRRFFFVRLEPILPIRTLPPWFD
jgi:hypothetical protein